MPIRALDRIRARRRNGKSDTESRGAFYHVEYRSPFAEDAAVNAAAVLRHVASTRVVVLVDRERGSHPFFADANWLLWCWRRTGLDIERYDYSYRPDVLEPELGGPAITLDELAVRTAGRPLLVISRMACAPGARADSPSEPTWLDKLVFWPNRALIDPDPRPLGERDYLTGQVLTACASTRLGRFPMRPGGVIAAAHRLAGMPVAAPPEPGIRPLVEVRDAIAGWARCAALAPDPTWTQLEAIRHGIPELARALPDPGYIQRLIEWVWQCEPGADPLGPDGRRLHFPAGLVATLIAEQRAADARAPCQVRVEDRLRQLFISQLWASSPRSEAEEKKRRQQLAFQCAIMHRAPGRAGNHSRAPRRRLDHARHRARFGLAALARPGWIVGLASVALVVTGLSLDSSLDSSPTVEDEPPGSAPVLAGGPQLGSPLDQEPVPAAAAVESGGSSLGMAIASVERLVPYDPPAAPRGSERARPTGRAEGITHVALQEDAPLRFVGLTGGEFTIGSSHGEKGRDRDEGPRHRVYLSPYEISATEVSQKQWTLVMKDNPSACEIGCGDDMPVNNVPWEQTLEFANRLSHIEGLTPCYRGTERADSCTGYRLPTEAEWEYAARAGSRTVYSHGDDATELKRYAWHSDFSRRAAVRPVATKQPNRWGLYDMHGNVWEWVWDRYGRYQDKPQSNPSGPDTGQDRVVRGGSFAYSVRYLRAANRNIGKNVMRPGFRLVRSRVYSVPTELVLK